MNWGLGAHLSDGDSCRQGRPPVGRRRG